MRNTRFFGNFTPLLVFDKKNKSNRHCLRIENPKKFKNTKNTTPNNWAQIYLEKRCWIVQTVRSFKVYEKHLCFFLNFSLICAIFTWAKHSSEETTSNRAYFRIVDTKNSKTKNIINLFHILYFLYFCSLQSAMRRWLLPSGSRPGSQTSRSAPHTWGCRCSSGWPWWTATQSEWPATQPKWAATQPNRSSKQRPATSPSGRSEQWLRADAKLQEGWWPSSCGNI